MQFSTLIHYAVYTDSSIENFVIAMTNCTYALWNAVIT